ncbi:hypothetical protein HW555_011650 [Spodoptera exigua]|uniref:Uncharacterized protein n=1 Tax=Spodoptera exigua TaxID=7107 RepID=A0A835G783_SPOEX|nr:hypothetical protein HW555_011650 [Spodoptera exigua]
MLRNYNIDLLPLLLQLISVSEVAPSSISNSRKSPDLHPRLHQIPWSEEPSIIPSYPFYLLTGVPRIGTGSHHLCYERFLYQYEISDCQQRKSSKHDESSLQYSRIVEINLYWFFGVKQWVLVVGPEGGLTSPDCEVFSAVATTSCPPSVWRTELTSASLLTLSNFAALCTEGHSENLLLNSATRALVAPSLARFVAGLPNFGKGDS